MQDFMMWTASHVDLVKEVVAFQYDQFMQVSVSPPKNMQQAKTTATSSHTTAERPQKILENSFKVKV